jgi:hypothetical protein
LAVLVAACDGAIDDGTPPPASASASFLAQRKDGALVVLDAELVELRTLVTSVDEVVGATATDAYFEAGGVVLRVALSGELPVAVDAADAPSCAVDAGVAGCLGREAIVFDGAQLLTEAGVRLGDWSSIVEGGTTPDRIVATARGVATVASQSGRAFVVEQAFSDAPVIRSLPPTVRWAVPIP